MSVADYKCDVPSTSRPVLGCCEPDEPPGDGIWRRRLQQPYVGKTVPRPFDANHSVSYHSTPEVYFKQYLQWRVRGTNWVPWLGNSCNWDYTVVYDRWTGVSTTTWNEATCLSSSGWSNVYPHLTAGADIKWWESANNADHTHCVWPWRNFDDSLGRLDEWLSQENDWTSFISEVNSRCDALPFVQEGDFSLASYAELVSHGDGPGPSAGYTIHEEFHRNSDRLGVRCVGPFQWTDIDPPIDVSYGPLNNVNFVQQTVRFPRQTCTYPPPLVTGRSQPWQMGFIHKAYGIVGTGPCP